MLRINWLGRAVCAAVVCVLLGFPPSTLGAIREGYVMPEWHSEVRTTYSNGFDFCPQICRTVEAPGSDKYVYLSYDNSSDYEIPNPNGQGMIKVDRELYANAGLVTSWDHDSVDIVWNYDRSDLRFDGIALDVYRSPFWGGVVSWTSPGNHLDYAGRPLHSGTTMPFGVPIATITVTPTLYVGIPDDDPDFPDDPNWYPPSTYDLEIAYSNGRVEHTFGLPAFGEQVTTLDLAEVDMTGACHLGFVAASNGMGGYYSEWGWGNTYGIIAIDAIRGGERAGRQQTQPLFPSEYSAGGFEFDHGPSGSWFDPPYTDQFHFTFTADEDEDTVFEKIIFPDGFEATFEVWVGDQCLASGLSPGDEFVFVGGVRDFWIKGINPIGEDDTVDAALGDAFPLWLSFNTEYASVVMTVPEPATLGLLIIGGMALLRRRRSL